MLLLHSNMMNVTAYLTGFYNTILLTTWQLLLFYHPVYSQISKCIFTTMNTVVYKLEINIKYT